jgi:hypothetical protein
MVRRIRHYSGTVGLIRDLIMHKITFINMIVDNLSANVLYVSFDDGTDYKTIPANGALSVSTPQGVITVTNLYVKASAAATNFELLYVTEDFGTEGTYWSTGNK